MQRDYGYKPLTHEDRKKWAGLNLARLLKRNVEKKAPSSSGSGCGRLIRKDGPPVGGVTPWLVQKRQSEEIMELKDRVAIVTGAARGLGKCIAELLAKHGAKVALWDIQTIDLKKGSCC